MRDYPEKKSSNEPLDIKHKKERIINGDEPIPWNYPYILPDYSIKCLHIGTEKQLFIDNHIIDYMFDVKRVIEKPLKHNKAVMETGDLPWERYSNPACKVLYDEQERVFKMWYAQSLKGDEYNTDQALCYAESNDGINWIKPLDRGGLPYNGNKYTNITCFNCAGFEIIRNPDKSDDNKKYILFYSDYNEGKNAGIKRGYVNHLAFSKDGIKWEKIPDSIDFVLQHGPSISYDPAIKKYIAYSQHSHHWDWRNRRRQIGRQESDDLIRWTPKEIVITSQDNGNMGPDIEFGAASIYKVDSLYIGIISRYKMDPVWKIGQGASWRDYTHPCLLLASSRDGEKWNFIGNVDKPWVENGPPGSIDYGYVDCPTAPIAYKNKLYFYYLAGPHKQGIVPGEERCIWPRVPQTGEYLYENLNMFSIHKWQISTDNMNPGKKKLKRSVGLYTLREDGYVAIIPEYEEGDLLTVQFVFEGNRLYINADANYGWVKVEILDETMEPIEGFTYNDCDPIYGDSTAHEVKWKGNPDVSALWNRCIRLKIHIRDAYLYSFKFGYA